MPWSDIWSATQLCVASAVQNWDQNRPYTATLTQRREGFTEQWGDAESDADDNSKSTSMSTILRDPAGAAAVVELGQPPLRLVQYRPAWNEQLVLRAAGLPHRVLNSPYAAHELTGPLPLLQDLSGSMAAPAMVGRHQQTYTTANNNKNERQGYAGDDFADSNHYHHHHNDNAILDYLQRYRAIDLDQSLNDDQRQQSVLFTTLIRETLEPCLVTLRYGGDGDDSCWEQIYRTQCLRACAGPRGDSNQQQRPWLLFLRPLAVWQAWSERLHALARNKPTRDPVETARRAYQVLEHQLVLKNNQETVRNSSHGGTSARQPSHSYLLGTSKPTVVDCLLWDHLMQALTDIHLVVLLADFPQLLHYTQHIWDTYHFGEAVDSNPRRSKIAGTSLSVWNFEENALNAFNEVPLLPARRQEDDDEPLRHAVDLMKKLSVCHLAESLRLTKNARQQQDIASRSHRRPFATWHRWRMGGTLHEASKEEVPATAKATSQQEQQIQRDYQRNDEIWLAGVAATTLAVILGFGFAGGNR